MSKLSVLVRRLLNKKNGALANIPISEETETSARTEFDRKAEKLEKCGICFLPDQLVKTPQGVTFCLSGDLEEMTDFSVLWEIFYDGVYDIKMPTDKKGVVFDIGLNVGGATLFFAAKPEISKLFSFEPFLPTYEKARKNIGLNPSLAEKIMTFSFGLGKENKTLETPYSADISGDMSTTVDRLQWEEKYHDRESTLEKVEIRNAAEVLGPLFDKLSDERIILKIDTEGAEFDIIESLDTASLLERVDLIMMEYHFANPKTLEDTLIRNGFSVIYRDYYHEGVTNGLMYAFQLRR